VARFSDKIVLKQQLALMPTADSSIRIELIATESCKPGLFGCCRAIHIVGTGNGWT
jgi:hypothetical protein